MSSPLRFQSQDAILIHEFIEFERERLFVVHQNFLDEYGGAYETMSPRFAQERHDPNRIIDQDKARFEYLLGPDVAHDTHPISQWAIVKEMLACDDALRQHLGPEGVTALEFAEITHDFGEAVLRRDIAKGDETDDDVREEQAAWAKAIETTAPDRYRGYLLEVVQPIIFDNGESLHADHDVAESIGYILTGMRACRYRFFQPNMLRPKELPIMESIARDVRNRQSHVVDKAPEYKALQNLYVSWSREWAEAA